MPDALDLFWDKICKKEEASFCCNLLNRILFQANEEQMNQADFSQFRLDDHKLSFCGNLAGKIFYFRNLKELHLLLVYFYSADTVSTGVPL